MEQQLVSVIVNLKQGKYLDKTLESLKNQLFNEFEVILVHGIDATDPKNEIPDLDKDSKKRIMKLSASYGFKFVDYRYTFETKESAYTKGLEMSSGSYVVFLETNDILVNCALKEFYSTAKQHEADVVVSAHDVYTTYTLDDIDFNKESKREIFSNIDLSKPFILEDKRICNKLIRRAFLTENNIAFTSRLEMAKIDFMYDIYTSDPKCIVLDESIVYENTPLGVEVPFIVFNDEVDMYVDLALAYDNIESMYQERVRPKLDKKSAKEYDKAILFARLNSYKQYIYSNYWVLKQHVKMMMKTDILNMYKKFNTSQWQDVRKVFYDLPLVELPTTPRQLMAHSVITIAVFGGYLNTIDCVIDTIMSLYKNTSVRFNVVVPKYIYQLLPKPMKIRRNITFIDDYGKNSFYNKVLKSTKSKFIIFTHGGYRYDFAVERMYTRLKNNNSDLATAPVYYLDENGKKNIIEYSEKGFNCDNKNNFDMMSDDIYDCILPNKLIRVDYLKSLNMTFDGYDFTSSLTIMKNACVERIDMDRIILTDRQIEDKKFDIIDIERVRITQEEISKRLLFVDFAGKKLVQNLQLLRNSLLKEKTKVSIDYLFANLNNESVDRQELVEQFNILKSKSDLVIAADDIKSLIKTDIDAATLIVCPPYKEIESTGYDMLVGHEDMNENLADVVDIGTPVVDFINNEIAKVSLRQNFSTAYPESYEKVVIVVTAKRSASKIFSGVDFKELMKKYGENYYIVVSMPKAKEYFDGIKYNLCDFVMINDNKALRYSEEIMVSDILLTTIKTQHYYAKAANKFTKHMTYQEGDSIDFDSLIAEFEMERGNSSNNTKKMIGLILEEKITNTEEMTDDEKLSDRQIHSNEDKNNDYKEYDDNSENEGGADALDETII